MLRVLRPAISGSFPAPAVAQQRFHLREATAERYLRMHISHRVNVHLEERRFLGAAPEEAEALGDFVRRGDPPPFYVPEGVRVFVAFGVCGEGRGAAEPRAAHPCPATTVGHDAANAAGVNQFNALCGRW